MYHSPLAAGCPAARPSSSLRCFVFWPLPEHRPPRMPASAAFLRGRRMRADSTARSTIPAPSATRPGCLRYRRQPLLPLLPPAAGAASGKDPTDAICGIEIASLGVTGGRQGARPAQQRRDSKHLPGMLNSPNPTDLLQGNFAKLVMPGLVPGIHVLTALNRKDVDGRDEPGHDENGDTVGWAKARLRRAHHLSTAQF